MDFMAMNEAAINLYKDINRSETILGKVGSVVDGFQGDLERISDEVRSLQERSETFHIQLRNRRTLNKFLSNYLDRTLLTDDLIEVLCNQDIEKDVDDFLNKVEKLNEMVIYVQNPPNAVGQNSKSL